MKAAEYCFRILLATLTLAMFHYIVFGRLWLTGVLALCLFCGSVPLMLCCLTLCVSCVTFSHPSFAFFRAPGFTPADAVFTGTAIMAALLALFGRLGTPVLSQPAGPNSAWVARQVRFLLGWSAVLCAGALLLRAIHPALALVAAVMSGLMFMSLGGRPPSGRREFAAIGRGLLYVLFLSFVVPAIVEGTLRCFVQPSLPISGYYDWDPEYCFLPRPFGGGPCYYATGLDEKDSVPVALSSIGLRDREFGPKEKDEFRVFMLGDSFTFGAGVTVENTIPKQLESLLKTLPLSRKASVINGGSGGTGPIQQFGILKKIGLPLKPDLVVYQLFPTNDIEDCLIRVNKRQRAYSEEYHAFLLEWRYLNLFPYRLERMLTAYSYIYQSVKKRSRMTPWVVNTLHGIRAYPAFEEPPPMPPSEDRPYYMETYLKDWYPELDEGMTILEEQVLKIRDLCRENGIDLLIYCMPGTLDINEVTWRESQIRFGDKAEYVPRKAQDAVEAFLRREKLPMLSITDAMAAHPDVASLFYRYDGHCTAQGYRFVAGQIRDVLVRQYLPEKRLLNPK